MKQHEVRGIKKENGNLFGRQFRFGENWRAYSDRISSKNYFEAKESLNALIPFVGGKTFIDIGCGSGLFSIAAAGLGASQVIGLDIDPVCVEVSKKNLDRFLSIEKNINKEKVHFLRNSILEGENRFGQYDIVYSWGVLHHTGRMWDAFRKTADLVKPGGALVLSIYNKHATSGIWKEIKKFYSTSPHWVKRIMIWGFCPVIFSAKVLIMRKNPFNMRRGMSFYHNVVDWVGGYPYEYATVCEVTDFFKSLGFEAKKVLETDRFTGCNEYVFKKTPDAEP